MSAYSKGYQTSARFHKVSFFLLVMLSLFWCTSVQGRTWNVGGNSDNRSRSRANNQYVSLYEHENYRGKVHRQPVGKECSNVPRAFSNWASSIILHDRCVTLCEFRDCQGPCINVIPNEKGKKKLSALGLNDKVSSVKACNQFF
ncbi:hypothetical protein Ocin01_17699 [Orchesella cincta]|uniref:Uncharacterized protein n=1 Tax=Orchesella cincta TaxID=48709 RepID=A0A1D2M7N2_ORCCI|nr:hypothetical protein Ocin01_17699 [Orchesella cincta]